MYEIEIVTDVAAPAERVWGVLTAFREYDEWNPLMTRMRAGLSVGAEVSFVVAVFGRELPIDAELLVVEPGRELRWRGPRSWLLSRGFRGEHYLRVEPVGAAACRFVHGEKFAGAALPLCWSRLEPELLRGYGAMNAAVKARAEAGR